MYAVWRQPGARDGCFELFDKRVQAMAAPGLTVCDLGGGANPLLDLELISERELRYVVVDISESELSKAPASYEKQIADICAADPPARSSYDLVFSKSLAEHVTNASRFHENVYAMLKPGGKALHFFSTLYALPFVVNRVLPDRISAPLLGFVQKAPEDPDRPKFPARYEWCRGPTRRQRVRLERIGFRVLRYSGYFGHGYFAKAPQLQTLNDRLAAFLVRHPVPILTSYAIVELEKPLASA
jgi:SAM-dependent methyltransferase